MKRIIRINSGMNCFYERNTAYNRKNTVPITEHKL